MYANRRGLHSFEECKAGRRLCAYYGSASRPGNLLNTANRLVTVEARRRRIVQLLENEGNVKVEELAVLFEVSQVTVRKDLAELEEQGMLQRTFDLSTSSRVQCLRLWSCRVQDMRSY
jgi:DNA-binding transcriptional ArsR family regulator